MKTLESPCERDIPGKPNLPYFDQSVAYVVPARVNINSLIKSGAFSPVYNGPVQSELNESSRHINTRFHTLRSKAEFEADFLNKSLSAPLYEQPRRRMDANENYSY
jgi:hypothetical protein